MLFTYAGWIDKTEVVEVTFDPKVTSYEALVRHAKARACISPVFTRNDRQQRIAAGIVGTRAQRTDTSVRGVRDNKYQLSRTPMRHLPLSRIQSTRINAAVGKADRWLSPRQRALLQQIRAHPKAGWPVLIGVKLSEAWTRAEAAAAKLKK